MVNIVEFFCNVCIKILVTFLLIGATSFLVENITNQLFFSIFPRKKIISDIEDIATTFRKLSMSVATGLAPLTALLFIMYVLFSCSSQ